MQLKVKLKFDSFTFYFKEHWTSRCFTLTSPHTLTFSHRPSKLRSEASADIPSILCFCNGGLKTQTWLTRLNDPSGKDAMICRCEVSGRKPDQ